jgi:hypothetical protein
MANAFLEVLLSGLFTSMLCVLVHWLTLREACIFDKDGLRQQGIRKSLSGIRQSLKLP